MMQRMILASRQWFVHQINTYFLLTEIAAFFEQDADYSTMGMIVNIDLQNGFLIYIYESAIIDYSHLGFSHDADCSISLFDNLAKK